MAAVGALGGGEASADELRRAARAMVARFVSSSTDGFADDATGTSSTGSIARAAWVATAALSHELGTITAEADTAASALSRAPAQAFSVAPMHVGRSAIAAMTYGTGIRYLERCLAALPDFGRGGSGDDIGALMIPSSCGSAEAGAEVSSLSLTAHRKRPPAAAAAQPGDAAAAWAQLHALYAAIGEDDIVGGILAAGLLGGGASRVGALLRSAAAAEASGPLEDAITAYSGAIAAAASDEGGGLGAAAMAPAAALEPAAMVAAAPEPDDDEVFLDEDFAVAPKAAAAAAAPLLANKHLAGGGAPSSSSSSAPPAQQVVLAWDDRRLQCAAALQQWPRVRHLVAGLVNQGGLPLPDAGPPTDDNGGEDGVGAAERCLGELSLLEGRCADLDGRRRALVQRVCLDLSLEQQGQRRREEDPDAEPAAGGLKPMRDMTRRLLAEATTAATARPSGSPLASLLRFDGGAAARALAAQAAGVQASGHVLRGELPRATAVVARGVAAVPFVFTSLPPLAVPARLRALLPLQVGRAGGVCMFVCFSILRHSRAPPAAASRGAARVRRLRLCSCRAAGSAGQRRRWERGPRLACRATGTVQPLGDAQRGWPRPLQHRRPHSLRRHHHWPRGLRRVGAGKEQRHRAPCCRVAWRRSHRGCLAGESGGS